MADMKRSLALLTSQQPAAVPSAPQQLAAPTPTPGKVTPANALSYAAKVAHAPKPGTHVPASKPPAPTTARVRHHPQRLVLKVRATAELAAHVRDNPSLLRSNVNAVLERHMTPAGTSLRVSSIAATASGNVVMVVADPLTAADLLDHAEDIAHTILSDSDAYVVGTNCDQAWYQVLVNGVSTRVHDVEGLPSGMEILAALNEFSSHKYDWASQLRWLGSANDLGHKTCGSVILAFKSEADALHAIEHSVCIFGQLCPVRHSEDMQRLRTCDNCCSLDHTARICTKPKRCGVCGSNEHTTASHSCNQMECKFYSTSCPAGLHDLALQIREADTLHVFSLAVQLFI
ncbi:hypothetical protein AURDEDRAFT_169008 [Auricularia subglabra TFB-10046 SS5]|nr:hypothetical protein AURDEDRAFT_169008 [Auricularia subglabra TFB-10046 SS5]